MTVFRFVGTAGILTYGTANILNGIWFGRKMVADIVDGIAYGLITGLIFAALWPGQPRMKQCSPQRHRGHREYISQDYRIDRIEEHFSSVDPVNPVKFCVIRVSVVNHLP